MSRKWFLSTKLQKSGCNGEIYLHTIFENQYYLPQQMWVYLYNILLTVVANSFVLHSKQSKIKTILLQSVLFYLLLIPQHFDNMPSWTMQLSLLTIVWAISCCIKTGLCKDNYFNCFYSYNISIGLLKLFYCGCSVWQFGKFLQEPYVYLVSVSVITTLLGLYTIIGNRFLKKQRYVL